MRRAETNAEPSTAAGRAPIEAQKSTESETREQARRRLSFEEQQWETEGGRVLPAETPPKQR